MAWFIEGITLDTNRLQTFKELVNLVIGQMFGSFGVTSEENLAFNNCKISGWQKRY